MLGVFRTPHYNPGGALPVAPSARTCPVQRLKPCRNARLIPAHGKTVDAAVKILSAPEPDLSVSLWQQMVQDCLDRGDSSKYKAAAKYCLAAEATTRFVERDGFLSHEVFLVRLKETHHRKRSFWERLDKEIQIANKPTKRAGGRR
jgi:hypothetical protein